MKKLVIIVFTLIILTGCSNSSDEEPSFDTNKYNLYKNSSFQIAYPNDWIITKSYEKAKHSQDKVIFIARANNKREKFHQNLNIHIVKSINDNFYGFIKGFTVNQKKELKKYTTIEKKEILINKVKTMLLTFKASETNMSNIITFIQTYIDGGEYYYIITCGSQDNSLNSSSQKCLDMINSFRLL